MSANVLASPALIPAATADPALQHQRLLARYDAAEAAGNEDIAGAIRRRVGDAAPGLFTRGAYEQRQGVQTEVTHGHADGLVATVPELQDDPDQSLPAALALPAAVEAAKTDPDEDSDTTGALTLVPATTPAAIAAPAEASREDEEAANARTRQQVADLRTLRERAELGELPTATPANATAAPVVEAPAPPVVPKPVTRAQTPSAVGQRPAAAEAPASAPARRTHGEAVTRAEQSLTELLKGLRDSGADPKLLDRLILEHGHLLTYARRGAAAFEHQEQPAAVRAQRFAGRIVASAQARIEAIREGARERVRELTFRIAAVALDRQGVIQFPPELLPYIHANRNTRMQRDIELAALNPKSWEYRIKALIPVLPGRR